MGPLEFFLPMRPPTATAQEREVRVLKGNRVVFYDPPQVVDARAKIEAHLAKHAPEHPIRGPVRLVTRWLYMIPLGSGHKSGEYKTTKPDTDNSIKLLKDCMTHTGFWTDDALVVSELTEKFWANVPGIYVKVEPLL